MKINKKPSPDLWFNFIESLVCKYHLEDSFLNTDLQSSLDSLQPPENYFFDRAALKLAFNNFQPFPPTLVLQNILTALINKAITSEELPLYLQNELNIPQETAIQIAKDIIANPLVLKEMNEDITQEENKTALSDSEFENFLNVLFEQEEEPSLPEEKPSFKGLNQDLL